MNSQLIISLRSTNPDSVGANNYVKSKKLSLTGMLLKYLTTLGKEINSSIIKEDKPKDKKQDFTHRLSKLLKKQIVKKHSSKDIIDLKDFLQLVDEKQIDYSEYQSLFEIILKNQQTLIADDILKIIFTQTRNSNGALPSNIEVFLYRFLIINIININNSIHDYDEHFLKLLQFLFNIPHYYIEECIYLLSIIFNDLLILINKHISNKDYQNDSNTNKFIESLSIICINYLLDEILTNHNHFTTYEMQCFLQAHLVEQMIYFCPENITHLKHIMTALTKVNLKVSNTDIPFFYDPIIKSTSCFISNSLQQLSQQTENSNTNDNLTINFIFFLMDKIFLISDEIIKFNDIKNTTELISSQNSIFKSLPVDFSNFVNYIIDTSKFITSLNTESFSKFSEKEKGLFNCDKNYKESDSIIIESRDKKYIFDFKDLKEKADHNNAYSIVDNVFISFNNDFSYLNKFVSQMTKYANKIILIVILKGLSSIILNQIDEQKTIKSAAKMYILINLLLQFPSEDFFIFMSEMNSSENPNEPKFSSNLVDIFVFDEKYFYFSNPTSKNSVLYTFLNHDKNDSLFYITNQIPVDLELYENLRKSILSLFCKHFQFLSTNFINLIKKKIENSVQPQISNFFISMLRLFFHFYPDLTTQTMRTTSFFDSFSTNYLQRLRNYYIFYRENSLVADHVQEYRYNSMMFIIQLLHNPSHFQALFSSSNIVDYFFKYGLFEEDNSALVINLIKNAFYSFDTPKLDVEINNITSSLIKTIENCSIGINKKMDDNSKFNYPSYCLQLLHNLLSMFGECLQTKSPVFSQSLIDQNFHSILCQIPNKISPIDNQLKLDVINDILYIICGMTKGNDEIKKRFIGQMKKQKLAQFLNSIEIDDKTIQYLLLLIFEKEIDLTKNNSVDIKFNKALPFLHTALLNKKQYDQIFLLIYGITATSFTNKIQIYKSKLLNLFIVEIQKYPSIDQISKEKLATLDIMFNIFQIVTSSLAKPQILLEVLKALQKKDNKERPWYVSQFIKIFNMILTKNEEVEGVKYNSQSGSTSFFHFNGKKTGISVPQFNITDKESFSFVCRFQLDENYSNTNCEKPTFLSFSVNENKIKLFFQKNCLHIKHKTIRKTKNTGNNCDIEKVNFNFVTNTWYTLVLRGTSNDKLELFINSEKPIHTLSIKHCTFDTITSFIVANSSLEKEKGIACNISVIYFFNKSISSDKIKDLNLLPYKFSYLFTPSNQCLYPNLPRSLFADEKFEKSLIFCYNSNMFDGYSAVNLVRGTSTIAKVKGLNVPYNSSFIGAIASLGGIKAFLPLLEIIDSSSVEEDNRNLLNMILEIFIYLNHSSADFENEFCNSNGIQAFAHAFSKLSKTNITKDTFASLHKFYLSFRYESNFIIFLQMFWFNYNVWDKMSLEQNQELLNICLKPILQTHEELFKKHISYPFLLAVLKDISNDNVREFFFTFIEFYAQHYFIKQDQKFMIQLAFTSEGVYQGQLMKTFYTIMEKGHECYYRIYGTNVYNNLIALSSSSDEEARIHAIKIFVYVKNKKYKEPLPLNTVILSFIKTLNFENLTDRTWNELEKSIFEENKISERIIELLPLFSSYSYLSAPTLSHDFLQKLYDISIKNHECFKIILLSPNWVLNLFYIYLHSKKPILNFGEDDVFVHYFEEMFLFLISSSNIDEYRNALNELLLIQYIHYFDVSLITRQIFTAIMKRKESQSPNVYKIILPDIFIHLFYMPTYNAGSEVVEFQSFYDHTKQNLSWIDFILRFNFRSKSIYRTHSNSSTNREEILSSSSEGIISLSSNNNIKIKIDFSNFKGNFAARITKEGKWADIELVEALSSQFVNIMKNLQGKQVDKFMTFSGHSSYKLSISLYDFYSIIEMMRVNLNIKPFGDIVPLLCSYFLKSSTNKKQSLQIICYLASPKIDIDDRAEILYGYVKTEYPKEIDSFIKKEKKNSQDEIGKNKMNEKSTQIKLIEYFCKGIDQIFDSINNDCTTFYKNIKDITELAKSSLEMIQQESHIMIPRIKFVQHFNDQYTFILLNIKDTCLSAYQKISKEIISYESGNNEKTDLHWKICKRVDSDLRHIYYTINNHFDHEKYKKLSKSVNLNLPIRSIQASSASSEIKIKSSSALIVDDQELDDNDDDDTVNSETANNDFDDDEENDPNPSKLSPQSSIDSVDANMTKKQKENYLFATKAVLIQVAKHFSGKLMINKNSVTFVGKEMSSLMNSTSIPDKYLSSKKKQDNNNNEEEEKNETLSNAKTVQFQLSDIKWFLLRNYLHIKEGFEVFLMNHKSYFFFLTEFNRFSLINFLSKYRKSLTNCTIFQSSPEKIFQIIQESKIVESWINGRITNYKYLIILNLLAGRSFNDTTQYPIFPWILSEYNSDEIDLDDESIYRDLSRPINTLGEDKLEKLKMAYDCIEDDDEENKIHNRIFYSNDMSVSIQLIRVEPFTTTYLNTQKSFDLERFPNSLSKLYNASIEVNGFELVPEYFTTPEVFVNNDKEIVYGNDSYNKVVLPNWCKEQNPADFVKKHRTALESDYVSCHLNEWIDLVFGFAQTGKEAINHYNTFPPKLYSRYMARHKNQIKEDPSLFKIVQDTAFCFGIVPGQLFREKHPQRTVKFEWMSLLFTHKFSSKTNEISPINFDSKILENSIVNVNIGSNKMSTKTIPLFAATNENLLVVLSSNSLLSVFPSKSSFEDFSNEKVESTKTQSFNSPSKSRANLAKIKSVATDLSMFVLLKSGAVEDVKTSSSLATTKSFAFLSNKLVVTSPLDSEIRIFQIRPEDFNYLIHSSSAQEFNLQNCLDLTYLKPSSGSCVCGLYSTIQLPSAVLMTCKAGEDEFLSVSNDFSVMKWSMKEKSDENNNEETTTTNNYEFGSQTDQNSEGTVKGRLDRRQRKSSLSNLKLLSSFMNRVKMIYRIIPHSTKIVAIDACNKINIIASCDKEKNLTLSRLTNGAFIRSFKTPHKAKSVIVSDTPCIVVSQISKSDTFEKESVFAYESSIVTFSINNNKNDNENEIPVANRVFNKKTLTAWCEIDDGFGFDNYLCCCFDDQTLVILSLPMLDVVYQSRLVANATHVTFNKEFSVLVVACKDGNLYRLKC